MTILEKKDLEILAEKKIMDLRLDVSPNRATDEICVLWYDGEKISGSKFQYFVDYIKSRNIFKNIVVMPSGDYLTTMSKDEFTRWVDKFNQQLKDLKE